MPVLAKTEGRSIAPTYPQPGIGSWWAIMIRPLYPRESPVTIVQKLVGIGEGLNGMLYLAPKWMRSADHPARSQPLYQPPVMIGRL
jgi:hypothetical protein